MVVITDARLDTDKLAGVEFSSVDESSSEPRSASVQMELELEDDKPGEREQSDYMLNTPPNQSLLQK